jgi:GNAT superfamily N-acetyltransferase
MVNYSVRSAQEFPDLIPRIAQLSRSLFPPYVFEGDQAIRESWEPLLSSASRCQFALFDGEEMVAAGVTTPLKWDGTRDSLPDTSAGLYPDSMENGNVLCALAGLVVPGFQRKGLSKEILLTMKRFAKQHGFNSLIAPVRPNHKERYPLVSISDYIQWRREDGYYFDPWMRVHERLGASLLQIMPEGVKARGTVSQWEEWTGMRFMSSGSYVVPRALAPIKIDLEKNEGIYIEPNVWMEHRIDIQR